MPPRDHQLTCGQRRPQLGRKAVGDEDLSARMLQQGGRHGVGRPTLRLQSSQISDPLRRLEVATTDQRNRGRGDCRSEAGRGPERLDGVRAAAARAPVAGGAQESLVVRHVVCLSSGVPRTWPTRPPGADAPARKVQPIATWAKRRDRVRC